jgi:hypothetical protein
MIIGRQFVESLPMVPLYLIISLYNVGWGLWCLTLFQQYLVAVSFIVGGNRSGQRKPPTCRKSLTNFITQCFIISILPS